MSTQLDICNLALLKLGEKPITSLSETGAAATLAAALFAPAVQSLLDSYQWKFAAGEEPLVENFPEYFCNVLSLKLAEEFCMPLCDNPTLMRTVRELFKEELKNAKLIDMRANGASAVSGFSLIDQRF